jgi:hypothetical protein
MKTLNALLQQSKEQTELLRQQTELLRQIADDARIIRQNIQEPACFKLTYSNPSAI